MMLLTQAMVRRFAEIGSQEGKGDDAIVVAKLFDPLGNWTWHLLEWDESTREFFGIVHGFELEYGYISLDEIEEVGRRRGGLGIERDLYWKECSVGEVRRSILEERAR